MPDCRWAAPRSSPSPSSRRPSCTSASAPWSARSCRRERGAIEVGGCILAIDFLLRVVADTAGAPWLHWLGPLGWVEELRAFSGSRAVVLILPLALTVILVAGVFLLQRRDIGAALVAPRDTAPPRLRLLSSPTALAWRTERVTITTWALGLGVFGFVVGTVAKSVANVGLSDDARRQLARLGGVDVTSPAGYVGLSFLFFVFAVGLFACGQLSAARREESEHRLETLFALPYGRVRWLVGRLLLTAGAVVVLSLVAGAGAGLGTLATGADLAFTRALEAGVNCVPASLLVLGLGALLSAIVPRQGVGVMYVLLGATFLWELFGALLSAPAWTLDLSPFHHLAPVPAKSIAGGSALAMIALGLLAAIAALGRFRARDLVGD